jgi:hypothetical protein
MPSVSPACSCDFSFLQSHHTALHLIIQTVITVIALSKRKHANCIEQTVSSCITTAARLSPLHRLLSYEHHTLAPKEEATERPSKQDGSISTHPLHYTHQHKRSNPEGTALCHHLARQVESYKAIEIL